jgi:hypothetical protein
MPYPVFPIRQKIPTHLAGTQSKNNWIIISNVYPFVLKAQFRGYIGTLRNQVTHCTKYKIYRHRHAQLK